ncbi:hypothetical protein HMPREF9127_0433 [Parvimonas sp. oral taxon 393 str. F0440]|nr:hypothetical protein HMPREF9127_0433 [Parvimonas sp. oral taxon 393 str. F0440]
MNKFFENLIYSDSLRSLIIKIVLSVIVFWLQKLLFIFLQRL